MTPPPCANCGHKYYEHEICTAWKKPDEILVPKSTADIEKWCDYFYKFDPIVQQFVDYVHPNYPPTFEQVVKLLTPHLKAFAWRDKERLKAWERYEKDTSN